MRVRLYALVAVIVIAGVSFFRWQQKNDLPALPKSVTFVRAATSGIGKEYIVDTSKVDLNHRGLGIGEYYEFPEDAWITGYRAEIQGAPPKVFHHNLQQIDEYSPFCLPEGSSVKYLTAFGRELTPVIFPEGYGYPIGKHTRVTNETMFHNRSQQVYKGISFRTYVTYVPSNTPGMRPAYPFYVNSEGKCNFQEFIITPGEKITKRMEKPYVFTKKARVIQMGAHMHEYTLSIIIRRNNEEIARIIPVKNEDGEIVEIPYSNPKDLYFYPGDELTSEITYHNTSDKPIQAMANMMFFLSPEETYWEAWRRTLFFHMHSFLHDFQDFFSSLNRIPSTTKPSPPAEH